MAEELEGLETAGEVGKHPPTRGAGRSLWRSIVLPLLVIGAIAGAIWWLDYRPQGGTSESGGRYGPIGLPAALIPPGMDVSPKEGSLAPDFILERLEGGDLRLSDLRGQAVVLNFWATWCVSCRKEIPQLVAAYDRYRDQGLEIVAVDLQESKAIVRSYAQDFGMDFPIVIDKDGRVAKAYRLLGVPTTFFIDREGVVRSVFMGPLLGEQGDTRVQGPIEKSDLEQRLEEILR